MERVHEMMNNHLAPGPGLDSVAAIQMEGMADMLNAGTPTDGRPITTNLYAWQRHIFGVCNMRAIYGPENIFVTHPETEKAFWDFEEGMLGLVVDIVPHITTRKAFKARRRVLDALIDFVKTKRYKKASDLIIDRVDTNLAFGMSQEMCGHSELILIFGIVGNAVPSNFWLIANIFSRPELLQRIREEVQKALSIEVPPKQVDSGLTRRLCTVDSKTISRSCPLLYSCYRETLRSISLLTSARLVLEDTLLAGQYLLRKDSVVQIAGGVIHLDPAVWGEDAESFNAERFLAKDSDGKQAVATPLPNGVPSPAFRAFGGGTVICPGRHFAQSELMTFAAVLALGFDILDIDGGPLRLPAKDDTRIPLSVMKPVHDPKVRIQRRKGWEHVEWNIRV